MNASIRPTTGSDQQMSAKSGAQTRTAKLRHMLHSAELEFLMEAHNGLSARIVREAGFKGIWASGLSISAQFGVRDNNEASWTQVVDMLEFMADAGELPILLDGDTGYGNFNNMRRLVRKLEQRGIAGVCIEDKQFPKTNSFLNGERQPLADVEEFVGKIAAGKDTQQDPNFSIVARVEALIAGWGMDEALRRAEAYRLAGADAIDTAGIKLVLNSRYAQTGELASLACAVDALDSDTVIAYGDLLFRSYVLRDLVECKADFSVVVDSLMSGSSNHTVRDFAYCSRGDDRGLFGTPVLLERVTGAADADRAPQGRWVGMLNVSRAGLLKLKAVLAELRAEDMFDTLDMPALLNALIASGAPIEVLYVHGHWRGVNDLDDLRQAVDFAHEQAPFDR
jgi:hypothetical protein